MDYDSSTKFISSLAKFLQSLCNGYVEFDNGVEVIGHIYLSVDTGKKIDYILNEKVCKTDENSVTFISNSFHAQPAEKPKPPSKRGKSEQVDEKPVEDVVQLDDGNNHVDARSTNSGTISRNPNRPLQSPRHGKRPFSPHSKPSSSPGSKKSRNESQDFVAGLNSEDGGHLTPSPSADPLRGQCHNSIAFTSESNYPQSNEQVFNPLDNSIPVGSEERDIKPSMDTDVTFVKEEFTPSSCSQEDDRNQNVDPTFPSLYHSNQSYPGGGNEAYGQQNSRLSYGGNGDRSDMYDPSMGSSQMEGNDGADPSGDSAIWPINTPPSDRRFKRNKVGSKSFSLKTCRKCGMVFRDAIEMNFHKKTCGGKQHLTCGVCSKVLSRYDALAEHLRGIHGIGNKVACRFCGKGFKYKPQVYQHQISCPEKLTKLDIVTASNSCASFLSGSIKSSSPSVLGFLPEVKADISFPYDSHV